MLPNKARGVPRVDDRRILNGIFWVLRSGAPWRDLPKSYGPHTTCYNRFVRWRRAGVWDQIMDALAVAHNAAVQMIDTSVVRVHQHGACIANNREQQMGRSRGGLTSRFTPSWTPMVCRCALVLRPVRLTTTGCVRRFVSKSQRDSTFYSSSRSQWLRHQAPEAPPQEFGLSTGRGRRSRVPRVTCSHMPITMSAASSTSRTLTRP